jgi:hypothetical protein
VDDGGLELSWEGMLIGGLIGVLVGSQGSSQVSAAELEAHRRAEVEREIVRRGKAAYEAAHRFGITPHLAADIIEAEDVIRTWQVRRDSQQLAYDLRHLRDAGRWFVFASATVFWSAIGFFPVAMGTAATLFALPLADPPNGSGWVILLMGTWPGLLAVLIAMALHDQAVERIPDEVRPTLHRHAKRWHAHPGAIVGHRHPADDPDGPVLR